MKYWEKFTEAELKTIIEYSNSLKDFCYNLGYNRYQSSVISKIKENFPSLESLLNSKKAKQIIDLTGQKFNHLKVLKLDSEKNAKEEKTFWICQCDCGREISVEAYNLKSGHTQSCGCIQGQKHRKDLTKKRFGKLIALEVDEDLTKEKKKVYWKCKCDCGNIKSVSTENLLSKHTTSCGCRTQSLGEEKISKILSENNISFISQYKFPELKGIGNKLLIYDFAILNKNKKVCCLIEYQGIQHYQPREYFGGKQNFKIQKIHDERKKQYCIKNNYIFIDIPYIDYDKININYINNLAGVDLCQL